MGRAEAPIGSEMLPFLSSKMADSDRVPGVAGHGSQVTCKHIRPNSKNDRVADGGTRYWNDIASIYNLWSGSLCYAKSWPLMVNTHFVRFCTVHGHLQLHTNLFFIAFDKFEAKWPQDT